MKREEEQAARRREAEAALGVLGLLDIKRPKEDADESEWKQYLAKMALIHELGQQAEEIEEEQYRKADARHADDEGGEKAKLQGRSVRELADQIRTEIYEAEAHIAAAQACVEVLADRYRRILANKYFIPRNRLGYFESILPPHGPRRF